MQKRTLYRRLTTLTEISQTSILAVFVPTFDYFKNNAGYPGSDKSYQPYNPRMLVDNGNKITYHQRQTDSV